jgi:ketosteroid isomerase-like protein
MKRTLSISLILLLIAFSAFDNPQQKIPIISNSLSIGCTPSVWNFSALSDEKQVQNLIQDSFDSLFSAFNEDLILEYYTEDFLLLEQGEIWDIEFIRNYFKKAKTNTPIPIRTNRFEFITTKVEGNRAWVAYQNYASISRPDQEPTNLHWLESATAVRTAKGWRLDMLHSTRVEE